jgi:hypothetical protein
MCFWGGMVRAPVPGGDILKSKKSAVGGFISAVSKARLTALRSMEAAGCSALPSLGEVSADVVRLMRWLRRPRAPLMGISFRD